MFVIAIVFAQTKNRKTVIGLYVPINHARACRKLALPLQPVLFCGFSVSLLIRCFTHPGFVNKLR